MEKVKRAIDESKLILVLRGIPFEKTLKVADALYAGGVRVLELTFSATGNPSDEDTCRQIGMIVEKYKEKMVVGAGTVLCEEQVVMAKNAGARFIVSPDVNESVIMRTKKEGLISLPGAFTPTECAKAARLGADYVKLFPCGEMKASYIASLVAPLSHVKFLAVGGITLENLPAYMQAGAAGVGISTGIVSKASLLNDDYAEIESRAKKYLKLLSDY